MYKYKIMIIDDEIDRRIGYLLDFFTNAPIDNNRKLEQHQKETYKKQIALEFEVIYPRGYEILDEYVKNNPVDAYFLDVYLENENNKAWNLDKALSAICKYNPMAPIFMYSTDWRSEGVLTDVTTKFRHSFPGKTPSYYYELNWINEIVEEFREAIDQSQIADIQRERRYIKDMIVKAYNKTEKAPFSKNGDIAILHISDIQFGDSNFTKYDMGLWAEVIKVCKKLSEEGRISRIDLLAITGDISMNGKTIEMETAKYDMEQYLFKRLWQEEFETKEYQERILIVPGNHDYDLNFCTLDYLVSENGPNKNDRKIDFDKASESLKNSNKKKNNGNYQTMGLTAYKDFAYSITGNPIYYQRKNLNYVEKRYTSWNLRFVCLNTCTGISAEKTNGVALDKNEITEIVNRNYDDGCYTIVLSHHSPLFVTELSEPEKDDFENSCKNIMNLCHAKVWLSGHCHVQRDRAKCTTVQKTEVYEASTISLKEEWSDDSAYEVQTIDGRTLKSRRGFQIIVLQADQSNTYNPELIQYVFDDDGVAHEVRK